MTHPPPFGGTATPLDAPPESRRGCATAVLVSAALVLVLLGGGGVGLFVWLGGSGGDYDAAPDCAVAEGEALGELVKGNRPDLADSIDTQGQGWWDGNQCRWTTTEESAGMPSSVSVVFIRSGNRLGVAGETAARTDLEREPSGNDTSAVEDLGDEAVRWYDANTLHGCVAVRMSNLMISTCYEASTDFAATREIPEDEATEGALTMARDIVASLEGS
ncbi:hypothetical protein [Actinorugispora endophytica]|uniref:DUF3558 family protein n=1 Tax=Actinorugispora endophytica TaxID=1605990 RepID=A0A4R6UMQ2_9ACTN|nr:hypothetical protein [Actinorugispora endophytica]TDQ48201.1 hypothetical protein EV190_11915 [Actinorugispora endophytica]